jgi:hypothetical protein
MSHEINLEETLAIVRKNRVPESMYCIGGLGKGECVGISDENGQWQTYYSERGARTSVKTYANENDACLAFLKQLELHLKDYGLRLNLLAEAASN